MVDKTYNKNYYEKNKRRLSEKKRDKYENDEQYRGKILETSRKRAAMTEKPYRAAVKRRPKTVEMDGIRLYSITFVAQAVNRSIQTVRKWEKDGILPRTPFRSPSGMRLYTQQMIDIVSRVIKSRGMARLPNGDQSIFTEIAKKWKKIGIE